MKRLLLISILFFFPGFIFAQQFRAGLITGLTVTQISGDDLGGYDKPGLVAGGVVTMPLSKKFDLSMEILYFQKGSKRNANPEKEDYSSYLLRINYFEVPFLAQWNYSKRFTFEAGPTFGALLSQLEENELGAVPGDREFNKFELGIAGGMKVHFAKKFSFTMRIESSVLPVREHTSGETYRMNKGQYNAAVLMALQYTFRKKNE